MTLAAGTRLGPYEVLAPIGAGGMGEVYRARDTWLDRQVAIKVLPQRRSEDAEALARFEREAKAVAAPPQDEPSESRERLEIRNGSRRPSQLDGELQPESMYECVEAPQLWIATAGKQSVEVLPVEMRGLCKAGHASCFSQVA